jgi:sugar O-acyltransferase (sialic acid O-acetyltransferase NeuD family)
MSIKKTLHILPAGGFSHEVAALALACDFSDSCYYDDYKQEAGIKSPSELKLGAPVALAIGSSEERKNIYTSLKGDYHFPSLIHPSALLMSPDTIRIGKGAIICAGSILTTNISLGDFVIINLHSSVGHDCILGDFVSLMPGARLSGGVILEDGVYVGTNASILPGLRIGAGATIGAGAVVTKDVAPNSTVVGVPAKAI